MEEKRWKVISYIKEGKSIILVKNEYVDKNQYFIFKVESKRDDPPDDAASEAIVR
ncbi:hypothetical protein ACNQFZ_13285 [Schinkia sp. CFF1]